MDALPVLWPTVSDPGETGGLIDAAGVDFRERRGIDHSKHRYTVFDQGDVDGEVPVLGQKFLGPIQGIHEKKGAISSIGDDAGSHRLFRHHRNIGCEPRQPSENQLLCERVRPRDRGAVALYCHLVGAHGSIDFEYGGSGVKR